MPASIINKKFKRSFRLCSIPKGSFFVRFYLNFISVLFANSVSVSSPLLRLLFAKPVNGNPWKGFAKSISQKHWFYKVSDRFYRKKQTSKGIPFKVCFSSFSVFFCPSSFFIGDNGFCEKYAISTCEMTTFLFPLGVFIQTLNICI